MDKITVEDLDAEKFKQIVLSSYKLVYEDELVDRLGDSLLQRVLERIEELNTDEQANKPSSSRKSKTFGSAYAEWLSGLDATQSCMYLAEYDIEIALKLYWNEDYKLVQEAIKIKSTQDSQKTLAQLEACMYGFGGKYSDDTAGDSNTINLDELDPNDVKSALSGFGF